MVLAFRAAGLGHKGLHCSLRGEGATGGRADGRGEGPGTHHIVSFIEDHHCPLQVDAMCPATLQAGERMQLQLSGAAAAPGPLEARRGGSGSTALVSLSPYHLGHWAGPDTCCWRLVVGAGHCPPHWARHQVCVPGTRSTREHDPLHSSSAAPATAAWEGSHRRGV